MNRRTFLAGLFSVPAAAIAGQLPINSVVENEDEIFLSVDYDYMYFNKIDYGTYYNEFISVLADTLVTKAKATGYVIGAADKIDTLHIMYEIKKLGEKIFVCERNRTTGTSMYTSTPRSKGTFTIALKKAPVASEYRIIT